MVVFGRRGECSLGLIALTSNNAHNDLILDRCKHAWSVTAKQHKLSSPKIARTRAVERSEHARQVLVHFLVGCQDHCARVPKRCGCLR